MNRLFARAALALLVFLGVAGPTLAQGPLRAGTVIEQTLRIDGKSLSLPIGAWTVAADGASDWNDPDIGAYGYLRSVILLRIIDGRIDTVLEINANVLPTIDGWGMAAACSRQDLVLSVVRYRAGWDGSCYFVTHTMLWGDSTSIWRKARDFAAGNRLTIPRMALTAGFRAANGCALSFFGRNPQYRRRVHRSLARFRLVGAAPRPGPQTRRPRARRQRLGRGL